MIGRRASAPVADLVAESMQRLAVMLGAGVPPRSALQHLRSAPGGGERRIDDAAEASQAGDDVAAALGRPTAARAEEGARRQPVPEPWRIFAATWSIAHDTGAPIADALRDMATALRESAALDRSLAAALAGPRATARLVTVLPLVGLLFSALVGVDAVGALLGTVPGLVCLAAGSALLGLAAVWNRALVRRATPRSRLPGLGIDLTAVAVLGGGPLDGALATTEASLRRFALPDDSADRIAGILELSRAAGVPAAELLRSEAALVRSLARASGEARAAALAVRLLLPLGLCVLPAFLLLAVAPMMIALVSSTVRML